MMDTWTLIALFSALVGGVIGLKKGFVRTLFSWAAPIIALLFVNQWAGALAAQFFPAVLKNKFHVILFSIALFLGSVCVVGIAASLFKRMIDGMFLGVVDHIAGFILGSFFACILVGFAYAFLIHFKIFPNPSQVALVLSDGALKTFRIVHNAVQP